MALSGGGIITGVLTWKEIRSMGFSGNKREWHYNGGNYNGGALYMYQLYFRYIHYVYVRHCT
jgi:hypothetical protein